jgi:hypothetical protein
MDVKVDKLVKAYVKIRDKRKEIATAYEEEDTKLKEMLEAVETELLEICKEMGTDGFKTEFGTVSRRVSSRYWTNDWHSFHQFLKEHGTMELLEKRISQANMATFLEENPDLLPPGLNIDRRYAVTVRRK